MESKKEFFFRFWVKVSFFLSFFVLCFFYASEKTFFCLQTNTKVRAHRRMEQRVKDEKLENDNFLMLCCSEFLLGYSGVEIWSDSIFLFGLSQQNVTSGRSWTRYSLIIDSKSAKAWMCFKGTWSESFCWDSWKKRSF